MMLRRPSSLLQLLGRWDEAILHKRDQPIMKTWESMRKTGDQGIEWPWIFAVETEAVAAGLIMLGVVVWKVCSGLSAANQTLTFDETLLITSVPLKHSQRTASSCRANVGIMCSIVGYSHATLCSAKLSFIQDRVPWCSNDQVWKATIFVLGDWSEFERF